MQNSISLCTGSRLIIWEWWSWWDQPG